MMGSSGLRKGLRFLSQHEAALKLDGSILSVFYTNAGDCPERILLSTIDLTSTGGTGKPQSLLWY